jgi:hypothetical protein
MDKRKTLSLIEQIKESCVRVMKSKEYKYANVPSDIFEAGGNSFSCTKKGNRRQIAQYKEPVW